MPRARPRTRRSRPADGARRRRHPRDRPRRERSRIMGLLDALLGGGRGGGDHQGFLQRFGQGQPWEGYTDQEVLSRYSSVAGQASPEEYEQAASDTFSRLTPEQRGELGGRLQH